MSEPFAEVFLSVDVCGGAAVVVAADEVTKPLIRVSCGTVDALITASAAEALPCALLEAAQQVEQ